MKNTTVEKKKRKKERKPKFFGFNSPNLNRFGQNSEYKGPMWEAIVRLSYRNWGKSRKGSRDENLKWPTRKQHRTGTEPDRSLISTIALFWDVPKLLKSDNGYSDFSENAGILGI